MLKEGMFYWEYSLEHLDDFPDPYYINDVIIIHPEEKKEFLDNVKRLRDLITAYCSLRENGINDGISKIISKIKEILLNVENINYTEFVAYWKSLDTQYGTFKEIPYKDDLLEILLNKYCDRRKRLYDYYGITNITVQALYDSGSSRSKGQKFKIKINDLVKSVLEIEPIFIEKKNWKSIKRSLKLKYRFGKNHQNKVPDFLIQYKGIYIIGEAKHIHNLGGAQDKQITELIEFIKYTEEGNIHYLSFLDGLYLHHFTQNHLSDKLKTQKKDIENALKKNSKNFFVNTKGLERLLEDLKDG